MAVSFVGQSHLADGVAAESESERLRLACKSEELRFDITDLFTHKNRLSQFYLKGCKFYLANLFLRINGEHGEGLFNHKDHR